MSDQNLIWEEIPWRKLEKYVSKMQRQICRAQESGKRRRVKWLKQKLVNSNANVLLSIRKVTQENNEKTAGVDEFVALENSDRIKLYEEIKQTNLKHYNPQPDKSAYSKDKPVEISVIKDRVIENIFKTALEPE